jgi:hypothetical protein
MNKHRSQFLLSHFRDEKIEVCRGNTTCPPYVILQLDSEVVRIWSQVSWTLESYLLLIHAFLGGVVKGGE